MKKEKIKEKVLEEEDIEFIKEALRIRIEQLKSSFNEGFEKNSDVSIQKQRDITDIGSKYETILKKLETIELTSRHDEKKIKELENRYEDCVTAENCMVLIKKERQKIKDRINAIKSKKCPSNEILSNAIIKELEEVHNFTDDTNKMIKTQIKEKDETWGCK